MIINVLDKGYVKLQDIMGNDSSIVRAARVSHDKDHTTGDDSERDRKLIRYLLYHGHSSPFEHCTLTFEVKAPIFVFREWMRHRTWSYNELSARYAPMESEWYTPDETRINIQSNKNKQASERDVLADRATELRHDIDSAQRSVYNTYRQLLKQGVAREVARTVLPVGMYSRMYATVNLGNLFKFLTLRDSPDAQWEIAEYARAIRDIARNEFPIAFEEWEKLQNES